VIGSLAPSPIEGTVISPKKWRLIVQLVKPGVRIPCGNVINILLQ